MSSSSGRNSPPSPPAPIGDRNDLEQFIRHNLSGYGIKKLPEKQLLIENVFNVAFNSFVPDSLVDSFQNLVLLRSQSKVNRKKVMDSQWCSVFICAFEELC